MQQLARRLLKRPSRPELEETLRGPLGDPSLELRFQDPESGRWDRPIDPRSGAAVTQVVRDGQAVALIHDKQLLDDPELLEAAGSFALIAAENASLDRAWNDAIRDLAASRARIVEAIDRERQRLATNLHDGAQQRLGALRLRLRTLSEVSREALVRERIQDMDELVAEAMDDIREISHRLYPRLLERGLIGALEHAIDPVAIQHNQVDRQRPEIEAAIYYCVVEAVQNATKHAGPQAGIRVAVEQTSAAITFAVSDNGPGFAPSASEGLGLQSLRDRLNTFNGELSINSTPTGTTIAGSIPLHAPS